MPDYFVESLEGQIGYYSMETAANEARRVSWLYPTEIVKLIGPDFEYEYQRGRLIGGQQQDKR